MTPNASPATQSRALMLLLVAVTLAFGWILAPFYGAVLWAVIVAIVFAPLNRWMLQRLRGRRNWAALGALVVIIVLVILPLFVLAASLVREGTRLVQRIQSGEFNVARVFESVVAALPRPVVELLDRFDLADLGDVQRRLAESAGRVSQYLATQVLDVGQNTLTFLVGLAVMLYLAFFFLRDGHLLARKVIHAIPLQGDHKQQLFGKFKTVIRATVKGNVLVAVAQGTLGGLAFWVLGIHGALLWAAVMAILSLLPAVGAGLVWVPAAIYLLATGDTWQGIGLVAYGVFVIGLVDNVLRPVVVGKETRMPDYVILVSTIGGLAIFGINGFVIGPVIAAMFIAVWDIFAPGRIAAPDDAGPPPSGGGKPPG
jgi:predicted PurR-regulated permease PerM